jgi:sugar lactone lactonase YvrE
MRHMTTTFALLLTLALLGLPALAQQNVINTAIGGGPSGMPAIDADLNGPAGVAVDSAGNYYFADYNTNRVYKVNTSGLLTLVAGNGLPGYAGDGVVGGAANALLNGPNDVAVDASGNIYIADANNCVVRKVDTTSTITTVTGNYNDGCGYNGNGSPATNYELNYPTSVATDSAGNVYIADQDNNRIRKLTVSTNTISNYAGNGTAGYGGDGGAATAAELYYPSAVRLDAAGNVYIADTYNYRIREVTISNGKINTIAGDGTYGYTGDGDPATSAEIGYIFALAVNSAGTTVTIVDYEYFVVRQLTVGGNINTVAGSGTPEFCGDGGPATSACFYYPDGVAVSGSNVYVADYDNHRIRLFTVGGNINTVAGNGSTTQPTLVTGVPPQGVVLNYPWAAIEDPSSNIFVSDSYNQMIRELAQPSDLVDFFAGNGTGGYGGDGGPATSAELYYPGGVARDSSGNIYIADSDNCLIRVVNTSGDISIFAGTTTPPYYNDCAYTGDGGSATSAELGYPQSVFVDSQNNVYIADTDNNVVRKVTGGIITTVAGNGHAGFTGDGGPATAAELYYPYAVAEDGAGNLYIADQYNHRVREVSAATGVISTVAGNGTAGFDGDGAATQHELYYPSDVRADANGNLFIADQSNQRLRWVSPGGVMTTFAGTGSGAYNGDGEPAINADLSYPSGIFEDASGNFLVSDQYNFRIRSISAFAGLGASASNLIYGVVAVGSTSAPLTLTLSGVGPAAISGILVSGPFEESDNCGTSLPNGQTCTVYVYFKPTGSGTETGSLTIENNGYFSTATVVNLQGTGTAISITGAPVSFGSVLDKTTSATKSVTVTNKGKTSITMGAITLSETTDFAIFSNNCPASGNPLVAKAKCTIELTFTPQSTGAKKGTLSINDSDPTSPQLVGMTGTGTSDVTFKPSSVDFGTQAIGTHSGATKITLTNTTGAQITLGNPAVSVSGPFLITGSTTCTSTLPVANHGTCVIYVEFSPTAAGYLTGTLSVADTDVTSPQTVALSGTGTGVEFTPSSLNVGSSTVGSEISNTVTVTNVGTSTITFTDAAITGANAADFSLSGSEPPCTGKLAPNATCTLTVYFTPSIVGKESATMLFYDNSAASPQSLALSGTGTH